MSSALLTCPTPPQPPQHALQQPTVQEQQHRKRNSATRTTQRKGKTVGSAHVHLVPQLVERVEELMELGEVPPELRLEPPDVDDRTSPISTSHRMQCDEERLPVLRQLDHGAEAAHVRRERRAREASRTVLQARADSRPGSDPAHN
eukprot:2600826-Rhodomonas_salina.3